MQEPGQSIQEPGVEQQGEMIDNLERLNANVERQMSPKRILFTGMIYGIGFVIGSAIIATIAIGISQPFFSDIPWVNDAFERGEDLIRKK